MKTTTIFHAKIKNPLFRKYQFLILTIIVGFIGLFAIQGDKDYPFLGVDYILNHLWCVFIFDVFLLWLSFQGGSIKITKEDNHLIAHLVTTKRKEKFKIVDYQYWWTYDLGGNEYEDKGYKNSSLEGRGEVNNVLLRVVLKGECEQEICLTQKLQKWQETPSGWTYDQEEIEFDGKLAILGAERMVKSLSIQ